MHAVWKALLSVAAIGLCAAPSPAQPQPDTRARIDRLLDAVRANDEALFATLVGGMESAGPTDAENGPQLGDYGASPQYYGPLTLASLRRFAAACRYDGPDPQAPPDPLQFGGRYTCDGEAGHTLGAQFSLDGLRAVWITIMTPADHRALAEQGDRIAAQDAVAEAAYRDEVGRVAGTVDALFAAAREGDSARFRALLGRGERGGPTLSDDRGAEPRVVPLTVEALRPIAAACSRTPGEEPYQRFDQFEQLLQDAAFICDGEPGYLLIARFERNGARISWLQLEGRVRRPFP